APGPGAKVERWPSSHSTVRNVPETPATTPCLLGAPLPAATSIRSPTSTMTPPVFFASSAEARRARDDRELGAATKAEAIDVTPVQLVRRNGEAEFREAAEQRSERELRFRACECGAETEMDPVAEREVMKVGAIDVNRLGVAVPGTVSIGAGQRDDDLRA